MRSTEVVGCRTSQLGLMERLSFEVSGAPYGFAPRKNGAKEWQNIVTAADKLSCRLAPHCLNNLVIARDIWPVPPDAQFFGGVFMLKILMSSKELLHDWGHTFDDALCRPNKPKPDHRCNRRPSGSPPHVMRHLFIVKAGASSCTRLTPSTKASMGGTFGINFFRCRLTPACCIPWARVTADFSECRSTRWPMVRMSSESGNQKSHCSRRGQPTRGIGSWVLIAQRQALVVSFETINMRGEYAKRWIGNINIPNFRQKLRAVAHWERCEIATREGGFAWNGAICIRLLRYGNSRNGDYCWIQHLLQNNM